EGVARVADQLAQEDLFVAVQRVDDDREDLVDLGLERELLGLLRGHGRSVPGLAAAAAPARRAFRGGGFLAAGRGFVKVSARTHPGGRALPAATVLAGTVAGRARVPCPGRDGA